MLVRAKISRPHSTGASDSTGWVPHRTRPMPVQGAKSGAISNGATWPHQPDSGCANAAWCRSGTQMKAGAPGPPFRYL